MNVTDKLANPPKKRLKDYVAVMLDASGSMDHRNLTKKAFDLLVEQSSNLKNLAADPSRDTLYRLYSFNAYVKPLSASPSRNDYRPTGGTALYDAILYATTSFEEYDDGSGENSFLVVLITDGEESGASGFSLSTVRQTLEENQATERWTYVALVPKGYRKSMEDMGFLPGNIEEWDTGDAKEVDRISGSTVMATQSYYAQSGITGQRSTKAFFTPDLSRFNPQDALRTLSDVTSQYKRVPVTKESRIDFFASFKTGKAYVPGTVYYPLTKTESRVRPGVEILLRDKHTGSIYGGNVRQVLSLAQAGVVRIEPGNHANWDIFIQSESENRLLVRGAHVLIKQ